MVLSACHARDPLALLRSPDEEWLRDPSETPCTTYSKNTVTGSREFRGKDGEVVLIPFAASGGQGH
jgi:hypothetical protein